MAKFRSEIFSKQALWTYIAGVALLALSAYCLGRSSHDLFTSTDGLHFKPFIILMLGGVAPLIIFVFIVVHEAVSTVRLWASAGFQHRLDELQKRMNDQDDFFQAINNNVFSTLTIYDRKDCYWFTNSSAARELGLSQSEVIGKTPAEVLGAERGRKILKYLQKVHQTGQATESVDQYKDAKGKPYFIQTNYKSLAPFGEFTGGVVAYGENVTTIMIERERRETMLKQVISTLVAVVDRRDPYAAGHSARVGQLSRALAGEMRLPEREIEAIEIAGSLMNFGKVLVSRAILTKIEALTADELQRVRDGILTSADILSLIDFNVPVVPILRQVLEKYDGTGVPEGIKGEAILVTARIVAVANAFVALVSPRAYRQGLAPSLALESLAKDAGKAFDPRIITLLGKVLENNPGHIDWLEAKATTESP